jgi:hypothetical protein
MAKGLAQDIQTHLVGQGLRGKLQGLSRERGRSNLKILMEDPHKIHPGG